MDFKTIEIEEFNVTGLSVRTKNEEGKAQKDIADLFGKLIGEDLLDKIPGKLTYEIYCVYTDYESDCNGEYTVIVGCKTENLKDIPQGFTGVTIPKNSYRHYKIAGGGNENVAQAWKEIWADGADRTYAADFDVYGENPDVDIYVSVK